MTEEDLRRKAELSRMIAELTDTVTHQNLDRAVVLAQMSARRQGPLMDFFKRIGRDYYKLAEYGPQKPGRRLRVVTGGAE